MADERTTFGAFLREKRQKKEITLRKFAEMAGLSPVHVSYMETEQRPAPGYEILARMAGILSLTKAERERLYDLAAESASKPRVPGDLPDYVNGNKLAKVALRLARDVDATDREWTEFIDKLRQRSEKESEGEKDGV